MVGAVMDESDGEFGATDAPERLVKSAERVRDLGEVFTPSKTVNEMLDMLPAEMWVVHPAPTFLEPACGDGNFLVAILERKLDAVALAYRDSGLPAGEGVDPMIFHGLEALSSIYAVDISPDNIIGGTPGHEIGARTRLLRRFWSWIETVSGISMDDTHFAARAAEWIVSHNILIGNMLPTDADGRDSGRDRLPVVEYEWDPGSLRVKLFETSMGSILSSSAYDGGLDIWGGAVEHWTGHHLELGSVKRVNSNL